MTWPPQRYPALRGSTFSSTLSPAETVPRRFCLSANERYPGSVARGAVGGMPNSQCAVCGGPLEDGYVATTNGSGLFWSRQASPTRFRPKGLEILVGTGFGGTYSANLPGARCGKCRTILVRLPAGK